MKQTLAQIFAALSPLVGWALTAVLDALALLSLAEAALVAIGLVAVHVTIAAAHQAHLRALLRKRARSGESGPLPWLTSLRLEVTWSVLTPVAAPLFMMGVPLVEGLRSLARFARRKERGQGKADGEKPDDAGAEAAQGRREREGAERRSPLLVAGIGPSFLWASLASMGVMLVALALEPLLRGPLGLASGQPVYDTLTIGRLPGGALALPLSSHVPRALVVLTFTYLVMVGGIARCVRLVLRSTLHANLIERRRDATLLPSWRSLAAHEELWRSQPSFDRWAVWLGAAVAAALALGLALSESPPYRVPPFVFALDLMLLAGWVLNMLLVGELVEPTPPAPQPQPKPTSSTVAGWPEVLAALASRGGLAPIAHAALPRALAQVAWAEAWPATVAPGLVELLPRPAGGDGHGAGARLTEMQAVVLDRLARVDRIGVASASSGGSLALDVAEIVTADDRSPGVSVVAPEGSGRTTLAMLAAVEHALSVSRTALVVLPTPERADDFAVAMRLRIAASTLRWNVRSRRMGAEASQDVDEGVTPDVIVASPADLLTPTLNRPELVDALGLIVVDDAEELVGPVETHVQLALRRLLARVRERRAARDPEADVRVRVLVLSGPSMSDAHLWHQALASGVEYGDPFRFDAVAAQAPSLPAAVVVEAGEPPSREALVGDELAGPVHVVHDLGRIAPAGGGRARLRLAEVIAACEEVGAPWLMRSARDGLRMGARVEHHLPHEPRHRTHDPASAAVVFVEGPVTCVDRELRRLAHAGSAVVEALREPLIAFVRVVDPDEAWAIIDGRAAAETALPALLVDLPRPAATHAVGLVRERHVAAELLLRAVEVDDIVKLFGIEPLGKLRQLAREQLVTLTTSRTLTLDGFRDRISLQLQARAVHDPGGDGADPGALFAPPPASVDEAAVCVAAVRDTASPELAWVVDAATAHRRFYPAAIVALDRGRFEVTARVAEYDVEGPRDGLSIDVSPRVDDIVSVPLRRSSVVRRGAAAGTLGGLERFDRKRVQFGRRALDVEAATVDVLTEHVATLHVSPDGRAVKNRMIFTRNSRDRVRGRFQTAGLLLYPEPAERRGDGPPLDRDGLRVLAAILRVAVAAAYRAADRSVEIVLQLDQAADSTTPRRPVDQQNDDAPDAGPARLVGVEDALVLVDAQQGGNGATRAIARDGVGPLLLVAWALLRDPPAGTDDARWRWLLLHDDVAPADDDVHLIDETGEASARELWGRAAPGLARWLAWRVDTHADLDVAGPDDRAATRSSTPLRLEPVSEEEAASLRKYGVFDPKHAGLAPIRASFGIASIEQLADFVALLDAAFEWIHARIAYRTDRDNYGKDEHVATIGEILERKSGDCEDLALLFASIVKEDGVTCRTVVLPGHALCQVALGDRPAEAIVARVLELEARRARSRGLRPMRFPNYQANVAEGWARPSTDRGDFTRIPGRSFGYFGGRDVEVRVTYDPDGSAWLCVDPAQSRVLGAVDTYRRPERFGLDAAQAKLRDDGTWAAGTLFIKCDVAPEGCQVSRVVDSPAVDPASPDDTTLAPPPRPPRPPSPRPHTRPRPDRPRDLPLEDLGAIFDDAVDPAQLGWRRLRWSFAPTATTSPRPYVVDVGIDVAVLDVEPRDIRVVEPSLKSSSTSTPPRVRERALDALRAVELARPTLEVFARRLAALLASMRLDSDDEQADRERAERLITRIVDETCLLPYLGPTRPRTAAVVTALLTGTADPWARTLLHAALRSLLLSSATLAFDERGWPVLVDTYDNPSTVVRGRWDLLLGSAR